MLEPLGLSTQAGDVYRAMLAHPDWGVDELSHRVGLSETEVRRALDSLADLALVRPSGSHDGVLLPVAPRAGLAGLLAGAEADIVARQRQIEATRAAIAALAAEHATEGERVDVRRLVDVDMVRARLEELAYTTRTECMSFTPGGAQLPTAMDASRPLNQLALERGVLIRNVYQESFRNDPATMAYARWLADNGGHSRIVPMVPLKMVIVDREVALIPVDPHDTGQGALEVRNPGLIAALCLLFEQIWDHATPFGSAPETDEHGLTPLECELIKLLAAGHTDETAGRRLGLSVRTVRRLMSDLTARLGAASRFQAGVNAAQRGWL